MNIKIKEGLWDVNDFYQFHELYLTISNTDINLIFNKKELVKDIQEIVKEKITIYNNHFVENTNKIDVFIKENLLNKKFSFNMIDKDVTSILIDYKINDYNALISFDIDKYFKCLDIELIFDNSFVNQLYTLSEKHSYSLKNRISVKRLYELEKYIINE